MIIIDTIEKMKNTAELVREEGKRIGFVPTMGYLHEGHLSLMKRAKEENDFVVVSIFVNPTQFGAEEDFETYPRNLQRDRQLAERAGVDVIFHPTSKEMYPKGYKTFVQVERITEKLCGASRPGHFRGVTTVVNKLFQIVKPNKAYFGQKDGQQVVVIEQMVKDLNMDVEIISCPIVREADGLAMSSRNTYLNDAERSAALVLSRSLLMAREMIENGERNAHQIKNLIVSTIEKEPLAAIDYVEVVHGESLEPVDRIKGKLLIALAVKIGKTRLIDNILMKV